MAALLRFRIPVRQAVGPGINFAGRIAGIAVTLLVVRYTGIGPSVVPVLIALAIFAFAQAALAGPVELQVIAEIGRRPALPPLRLLLTSLVLGSVVGFLLIAGTVGLSRLPGNLQPVAGYFLPLGLSVPFTSCFAAAQGIDIAHGQWMRSGIASFVRTVVIIVLVASMIGHVGLVVVPFAFFAGEIFRLGLLLGRRGWLDAAHLGLEWKFALRVGQQIPSSMISSIAPTLDRLVITTLGFGNIVVLDLAEKSTGFLNLSVAQGAIPPLYRRWALIEDPDRRRAEVLRTTKMILALCVPVAVVAAAALPPVLGAVVAVPVDTQSSLNLTLWLLLGGFPGYVASQTVVRLMILENLQRWFNLTAVVQLALNILLDLWFGAHFGVPGVAAATALMWWLGFALCYYVVVRTPLPQRSVFATGDPSD